MRIFHFALNTTFSIGFGYGLELQDWRSRTKCLVQFRVLHWILPIAFTAEQRPYFPRLPYACDEESQRHVPWIRVPSFAQFYSLLHRDLKRKGPSILRIHSATSTNFEQPATSPTVGSRICCSFLSDLTPEVVRNCIDWVAVETAWNQRHTSKDVRPAQFQMSNIR